MSASAMGHEQTEIDALATLRPDVLRDQIRAALDEFYDHTLAERVADAKRKWLDQTQEVLDANLDHGRLAQLRADAEAKLASLEAEIETLKDAMRAEISDVELPPIEVPDAEAPGGASPPDRQPVALG